MAKPAQALSGVVDFAVVHRQRIGEKGMPTTLGSQLKEARQRQGLSLRAVEKQTGIRNAHLSQIETDAIARPELAMLWELASLYGEDYEHLMRLAGYADRPATSGRQRQRRTAALRALDELSPGEQDEVLKYMADIRSTRRRGDDER